MIKLCPNLLYAKPTSSFPLQGIFSSPQIIFGVFPPPPVLSPIWFFLLKNVVVQNYTVHGDKCLLTVLLFTCIRRKSFLYYYSISLKRMLIHKKIIYNTSLNLNIDLHNYFMYLSICKDSKSGWHKHYTSEVVTAP